MKTRATERYYKDFTRPARDHGFDDEKRLQKEFSDDRLKLRWNIKKRECQIWYSSSTDLYCILPIQNRYNICWAIKELKQRERSSKEVADEYLKHQDQTQKNELNQIKEYTRPYAEAMYNQKIGKVSVTV